MANKLRQPKGVPMSIARMPADMDPGHWETFTDGNRAIIVRRSREIARGLAILKDQRLNRPKRDMNGYYGLAVLEQRLDDLEAIGSHSNAAAVRAAIVLARQRAAEDDKLIAEQDAERAHYAALEAEYGPVTAKRGLTLVQLLGEIAAMDRAVRDDPLIGFFKVCDHFGIEPIQAMRDVKSRQSDEALAQ